MDEHAAPGCASSPSDMRMSDDDGGGEATQEDFDHAFRQLLGYANDFHAARVALRGGSNDTAMYDAAERLFREHSDICIALASPLPGDLDYTTMLGSIENVRALLQRHMLEATTSAPSLRRNPKKVERFEPVLRRRPPKKPRPIMPAPATPTATPPLAQSPTRKATYVNKTFIRVDCAQMQERVDCKCTPTCTAKILYAVRCDTCEQLQHVRCSMLHFQTPMDVRDREFTPYCSACMPFWYIQSQRIVPWQFPAYADRAAERVTEHAVRALMRIPGFPFAALQRRFAYMWLDAENRVQFWTELACIGYLCIGHIAFADMSPADTFAKHLFQCLGTCNMQYTEDSVKLMDARAQISGSWPEFVYRILVHDYPGARAMVVPSSQAS